MEREGGLLVVMVCMVEKVLMLGEVWSKMV